MRVFMGFALMIILLPSTCFSSNWFESGPIGPIVPLFDDTWYKLDWEFLKNPTEKPMATIPDGLYILPEWEITLPEWSKTPDKLTPLSDRLKDNPLKAPGKPQIPIPKAPPYCPTRAELTI